MWKFVTRGIRETLERRICRTNIYSQIIQDNNTKNEVKKKSLSCNHKFIEACYSAYSNRFCGSTKFKGAKDNNEGTKWDTKHNWTEAVGWSSVLAVGWVVCQSLCFHRRFFNKDKNELLNFEISLLSQNRISYLLNEILNLHPKNILPVTNCINSTNKYISKEKTNEIETKEKFFGPMTVEEAFNEAADEFNNVHKLVMGKQELHFGLKALDEKRYSDAMRHFSAGIKFSSVESMFNLGLCYELGLGTLVDYTKAASYYDQAAKQGHADAMYNLGVFHAQGKGDFILDLDRARLYFKKAAQLGQIQAQQALDLENITEQSTSSDDISNVSNNDKYSVKVDDFQCGKSAKKLITKIANYTNIYSNQSRVEHNTNSSECQNIDKVKNSTEIFLDYLGLTEPNVVPVTISLDESRVQC
ncbi:protein SHC1-like [Vespula squamosa]|uniref:Protein SHC1-like n=1 Tax=Vespula squamosa TaxID=30214 RepID=A0ABD2AR89_VESSQ